MKKLLYAAAALIAAALLTATLFAAGEFANAGTYEEGSAVGSVATDKTEYAPGDKMTVRLSVKNNGSGPLSDVTAYVDLPDVVTPDDGKTVVALLGSDDALEPGGEKYVDLTATVGKGGAPWGIIIGCAAGGAAVIGAVVAAIVIKKKKGKGGGAAAAVLALALMPALAFALTVAVNATSPDAPHAEVKVMISGKEETVRMYLELGDKSGDGAVLPETVGITHFSMGEVTVEDDYCENALALEVKYLESFDTGRLLAGFRETAGLDMEGKKRYDGWENSLIGGHSVGHYLSAVAQAVANASVPEADREKLNAILTELVDGLLECQRNSRGEPGFIFGATLVNRNNVEAQFDNVEAGRANITTEAWVPWYTMHKIIAGLLDAYELAGDEHALEVAEGLGDWTYERASGWDASTQQRVLSIEYGGMNDCLYRLYACTGEEKYAVAAHKFDEEALFKRVALGQKDVLNDLHANTTIPKFLGALNRYMALDGKEIEGKTVDASEYLEYAEAFWDMVVERHTYITGGNSEWEHFGRDGILDGERTNCNCETCNVYNMLKLSRALFTITGERKYADYYENAFYNAILSSQNPKTGMTMYFQPMATGYFKVYSEPFTKFWCCTGSGMENFTKLGNSIYFHDNGTVYVNMYFDSTVSSGKFTLKQDSDIPVGDTSTFTVNADGGKITLALRIPDWAAGDPTVTLDGEKYSYTEKDGYAYVSDISGEHEVKITLPMKVTAHPLPDNDRVIGFKYGPIVLSAGLGKSDMTTTTTGVSVTIPASKVVDSEVLVLPDGVSPADFVKNIADYMKRDGDGLEFRLEGCDYVFGPHYEKYDERYGIYWQFMTAEEKDVADNGPKRTEEETLDTVQPGYGQYENDELHAMDESGSVGVTNDGTYRYAEAGGHFAYRMSVKKGADNYLVFTLRAEDNGKSLVIKSGDTVLWSSVLDYIGKEKTYEVRVRIPDGVVDRAEHITANGEEHDVIEVRFEGDGGESARVCEFIYVKEVKLLYEVDGDVAYFVDCGDHNVYTLSDGDSFGVYNSVTEQLYGYDPVTGKKWGFIDDPTDRYSGGSISGAIYTANTWAYEFNPKDGAPKTETNRYTKNQYENGIAERYLDYAFELENGKYEVEIGFADPWGCSNLHDVWANIDKADAVELASGYNVSSGALRATVNVTDGELTLNFRNKTQSGLAINVSYIIIRFAK